MIKDLLLHFGMAPAEVPVSCPAPLAGNPADPGGFIDPASINTAFNTVAFSSGIVVVAVLLCCYALSKTALGPRFASRWWFSAFASGLLCALAAFLILKYTGFYAAPGSCDTNPSAFPVDLPGGIVLGRTITGFFWGALAFIFASIITTMTIGRVEWGGGFFHNRGMPFPRILPRA